MGGQQASTFDGLRQLVCTSICHYLTLLFKFRSVKKGQCGARKANDRLGRKPLLAVILSNQICQLPSSGLPQILQSRPCSGYPSLYRSCRRQQLFKPKFAQPSMSVIQQLKLVLNLNPIACFKSEISFPPD